MLCVHILIYVTHRSWMNMERQSTVYSWIIEETQLVRECTATCSVPWCVSPVTTGQVSPIIGTDARVAAPFEQHISLLSDPLWMVRILVTKNRPVGKPLDSLIWPACVIHHIPKLHWLLCSQTLASNWLIPYARLSFCLSGINFVLVIRTLGSIWFVLQYGGCLRNYRDGRSYSHTLFFVCFIYIYLYLLILNPFGSHLNPPASSTTYQNCRALVTV
jgi:hypothetical protein